MSLIKLRPAGPNEHRCIIRQAVDFYRHLVVGGVYTVNKAVDLEECLIKALKLCVNTHPILSAVILDPESEKPHFAKPSHLDLRQHISISSPRSPSNASDPSSPSNGTAPDSRDWREQSRAFLLKTLDTRLPDVSKTPPWKVFATQLPPDASSSARRYLLLLGYGHSHGDGMSGLAFQRTLLRGLDLAMAADDSCPYDASPRCPTTSAALLPPIEKAGKLSVSAGYLLAPALSVYLPKFLSGPLGLRASAIPEAPGSWRGEPLMFYPGGDRLVSAAEVLRAPDATVQAALRACRLRQCRLTGLLHMLIVRALSTTLPSPSSSPSSTDASDGPNNVHSFVTQSAVDLRRAVPGLGPDDMGVCVTGYYEAFARTSEAADWAGWVSGDASHPIWARIRHTTSGLERQASTLRNQPVGLLRFLNDMRGWTLAHVGKKRDASYELSNLTAFDPYLAQPGRREEIEQRLRDDPEASVWRVESLLFAQPANVPGGCFDANVVTLKGGEMTIVFSWQRGALGLGGDGEEDVFMRRVADKVGDGLRELVDAEG